MLNPRPARLPPKSPFPAVPPGYGAAAPKAQHHRRSSESFLIEDPPSWLDDLLDEPETPARRPAHRRASSDSFACYEGAAAGAGWEASPGAFLDLKASPEADTKRAKHSRRDHSVPGSLLSVPGFGSFSTLLSWRGMFKHYMYVLAKGLEVSAELEFLDQQNLILNLENKSLKQRLDSLVQAQHIKHLQQEMLEREIARLKLQYQQQQLQLQLQQKQQAAPTHVRRNSRDLDFQFANLSLNHKEANSLKYKEANSARDTVAGPLYI